MTEPIEEQEHADDCTCEDCYQRRNDWLEFLEQERLSKQREADRWWLDNHSTGILTLGGKR